MNCWHLITQKYLCKYNSKLIGIYHCSFLVITGSMNYFMAHLYFLHRKLRDCFVCFHPKK